MVDYSIHRELVIVDDDGAIGFDLSSCGGWRVWWSDRVFNV
jgi:hypothetical protein